VVRLVTLGGKTISDPASAEPFMIRHAVRAASGKRRLLGLKGQSATLAYRSRSTLNFMRGILRTARAAVVPLCLCACGRLIAAIAGQDLNVFAGAEPSFEIQTDRASDAPLGKINCIALDLAGNVYFDDASRGVILRVAPDGTLTRVAGNGVLGWTGDGGPATNAGLYSPLALAFDSFNNLYIADWNRIRKVTPDGIITTILEARKQLPSFANDIGLSYLPGLAVDSKDRVYFSEYPAGRIWRLDSDGTLTRIAGDADGAKTVQDAYSLRDCD
jgi:hypothetical protein